MRNRLFNLVVFAAALIVFSCSKTDLNSPSEIKDISLNKATSYDFEVSVFAFGFDRPQGLAFDRKGRLYVADQGSGEISRVRPGDNSSVSPFAFGLDRPIHVVFNRRGQLFSTELGSGEVTLVKKGDNSGTPPLISGLNSPTYLLARGNRLFVSEVGGLIDEKITEFLIANGQVVNSRTVISYPDGINNNPEGMFMRGSKLFVSEQATGVIKRFKLTSDGLPIDAGSAPSFVTELNSPTGLAFDSKTKNLYVAGGEDVYEIDKHRNVRVIATGLSGTFNDIIVSKSGVIFVSNHGAGEIWKIVRS